MFDIDVWLNENKGASLDDYLNALINHEMKWKIENNGIFIDDHLLTYIPILEDLFFRKHGRFVDYLGLLNEHGMVQEDIYAILIDIIESGDSFFSGYLKC